MKELFPLIFAFLLIISLHSCSLATKEDQHPGVSTLEELIGANIVIQVEALDSTVMHTIKMLSDSLYYSKRQLLFFQDPKNKDAQKNATGYSIGNELRLKNVYGSKTYVVDTVNSDSTILMDKNRNIIIGDFLYAAPDYAVKQKMDSATSKNGFTNIGELAMELKNELPEFDQSIVYKWTNGRLPGFNKIYYYELNGQRFKSLGSECYRINSDPKYFYNARFGILKMK
ncbi:hypothetical protein [Niabella drilacis]|uniref:Uncharacterized protein n=1 Tax=Niabella drilacis (strain DSM 25811 / CCM 8410 / CCUG 62505 / LMG 26954 / E90) TaxID=1285928 RepID=A0A1G6TDA1_NIADE|nr:hypothetical protein [Niabella drilacis]SDD26834.1 hypothetical protein SAMN04487894_107172 [Niabella drilacis]